ncbi:DUF4174 domain-containing protein [Halomonas sp. McH1-25]|uniref:DUF4174 domain-containing protein n=1 Tax=unclassified Halomonas TaxID=2609666 RepID=UPI001EF5F3E9|nr:MULTISPECIES: DUF4174 domain-containing protein [unclassified Halomonas]MCG7600610.1 DUF4174 domain-containing protein [Halomonas sp. McH1-25]MCP1343233.1 DUF4174 domain-containing protein [Halomonas sp. FL8]MCP1359929.1 DUF4174 domain-containing protein [Halomonas sp. BBD45]MCP1365696.1 DUF4174 domain-containing protein [Halomonas sp. BBD48]
MLRLRYWFTLLGLVTLTIGLPSSGHALAADNPANPLVTDRGLFRPLILVTPSLDNADYHRIRMQLQAQRDAFEQRKMVLYSIEAGNGHRAGRPMTPYETQAVLEAMDVSPDGPLTVILVGMDGGKKMQLEGFVPPRQVFDIIDNMPIRRSDNERETPNQAPRP